MRFAYHQLDANHKAIRAGLEAVGATCEPKGPLDLVVGFRGRNYLLEIKTAKGKLRASQTAFLERWKGHAAVVRTMDEALQAIGAIQRRESPHDCGRRQTMSEPKLNEVVWIALSEKGWPVPFIGYSYRRKSVVQAYEQRFGHMLKRAGYRMVKVRLTRVKS